MMFLFFVLAKAEEVKKGAKTKAGKVTSMLLGCNLRYVKIMLCMLR